jgi:aspartyl-tRNA(Asn)/glutamyl-tRNA(Gln) amidotransferase subunit A
MADNAACRLKPTQNRIPRDGVTPLSTTRDSIGPLANSVACCAVADAVMAGELPIGPPPIPAEGLRLGVPQSYVLDGLAAEVANAFADACTTLSRAGARVIEWAEGADAGRCGGDRPVNLGVAEKR